MAEVIFWVKAIKQERESAAQVKSKSDRRMNIYALHFIQEQIDFFLNIHWKIEM